jgi:hypothetical protein
LKNYLLVFFVIGRSRLTEQRIPRFVVITHASAAVKTARARSMDHLVWALEVMNELSKFG